MVGTFGVGHIIFGVVVTICLGVGARGQFYGGHRFPSVQVFQDGLRVFGRGVFTVSGNGVNYLSICVGLYTTGVGFHVFGTTGDGRTPIFIQHFAIFGFNVTRNIYCVGRSALRLYTFGVVVALVGGSFLFVLSFNGHHGRVFGPGNGFFVQRGTMVIYVGGRVLLLGFDARILFVVCFGPSWSTHGGH